MRRIFALALISFANPCFGQVELESVLEGFVDGFAGDETVEFDNGPFEFEDALAPSDQLGLDDILSGFEDLQHHDDAEDESGLADTLPAWLRVGGTLKQEVIFNFSHDAPSAGQLDHRGLSSMRTRLDLAADANPDGNFRARLSGHALLDPIQRNRVERAVLGIVPGSQGHEAELDEAFVQVELTDAVDLTFGRQIVVWGRSDQFRVNDILNPVDNRMPGLTDIKNLRLPVSMARIDYYRGQWNASFILVPERRYDKSPEPGSDYYGSPNPPPPRDYPRDRFGNPDVALAVTGTFQGWDISFYSARYFSRSPHLEFTANGLRRRHHRISMLGTAANFVFGSWLLKAEAAMFRNIRYSNAPDREFTRISTAAGVEYSGIVDTTLAMEATHSRIHDFDNRLTALPDDRRENESAIAFRISRSFFNDALDLAMAALAAEPVGKNGGLLRLQAAYDLSDNVELYGGVLLYGSGSQLPFSRIGNNDRIFLGLDYHF